MGHRIVAKLGIARISNTEVLAMVERHLAAYGALELQEKNMCHQVQNILTLHQGRTKLNCS